MQQSRLRVLLVLVLLYLLTIFVVYPAGDFPANDDWAYFAAVRVLAFGHDWRPLGWGAMSLITQSVLAAPFCLATSCSFEALRASTLLAGVVLLIITYLLILQSSRSVFYAGLAAVAVAFNPILYALSYTFMTDILCCTLTVASLYFFIQSFHRDRVAPVAVACVLALAATLCRQIGLCVPLAFMIVSLLRPGRPVWRIVRSAGPLAVCAAVLSGYDQWMIRTGRIPAGYYVKSDELMSNLHHLFKPQVVQNIAFHVAATLLYLGLFTLPFLLTRRPADHATRSAAVRWLPTLAGAGAALVACAGMALNHHQMPVLKDIMVPQGIGPLLLRDQYFLHLDNIPALPAAFWAVVTLASVFGLFRFVEYTAAFLIAAAAAPLAIAQDARRATALFGVLCIVVYLAPVILGAWMFDRYVAAVVPFALVFIVSVTVPRVPATRLPQALAVLTCVVFGVYAVLGTHDFFSWNRARWAAIAALEHSATAGRDTLDGGMEYNGLRAYDPAYVATPDKSWWWIKDDTYQIAFGPEAGMKQVSRYSYVTYMPPDTRYIYVLRQDGRIPLASGTGPAGCALAAATCSQPEAKP